MKIVLTDCATLLSNNDLDLTIFEKYGEVKYYDALFGEELKAAVKDADIILCNKTLINKTRYQDIFRGKYNRYDFFQIKCDFSDGNCNWMSTGKADSRKGVQ